MRLFHIATASDWASAQESGRYTTSTRGRTLAEEGFVHASRADQWQGVRERFYADLTEPLVLLVIDPDLLSAPVVDERVPGSLETFPHVYGAIEVGAVTQALPLGPLETARREPVRSAPGSAEIATPPSLTRATADVGTFWSYFLGEVAFRATLGLAVLLLAGATAAALQAAGAGDVVTLAAMLAELVAGFVVGRALLRRRLRRTLATPSRPG